MSRWTRLISWGRSFKDQRGAAISIVLGFMALAVPAVTATLAFTATSTIASREARHASTSQFTVAGAMDYAVYKLVKVDGFRQGLSPGVPQYEIITLNHSDGAISWTKRAIPGGTPPEEAAPFTTTKIIDTAIIPASTPTDVTYTIEVTNTGTATATLDQIKDSMPPGFMYVSGSTTGVTTSNPAVYSWDDYDLFSFNYLIWNLDIDLAPSESVQLSFAVTVNAPDGYYCNVAWTKPGGQESGTGPTAKLQVGTPADSLCDNEAITVRKTVDPSTASSGIQTTFHYRIEVENHAANNRKMCWMYEVLPPGFSFVNGSVTGDITTGNPYLWQSGGQTHGIWIWCLFGWGGKWINAGQTKYLEFDATATLEPGEHANQVWANFDSLLNSAYSFPTAEVQVYDVYDLMVANDTTSVKAQVWMGAGDDYHVTQWQVTGPVE